VVNIYPSPDIMDFSENNSFVHWAPINVKIIFAKYLHKCLHISQIVSGSDRVNVWRGSGSFLQPGRN